MPHSTCEQQKSKENAYKDEKQALQHQSINQSINQSIKTNIFVCLRKKYSNSYYSASINLNLNICNELSHTFPELMSTPI